MQAVITLWRGLEAGEMLRRRASLQAEAGSTAMDRWLTHNSIEATPLPSRSTLYQEQDETLLHIHYKDTFPTCYHMRMRDRDCAC